MSLKIWVFKEQPSSADFNANFAAVTNMMVYNEDLTAYTNGSDITFDTVNKFEPGTLQVHLSDGPTGYMYRQKKGTGPSDGDYIEILDVNGDGESFQFNSVVPVTDSKLVVDYRLAIL